MVVEKKSEDLHCLARDTYYFRFIQTKLVELP